MLSTDGVVSVSKYKDCGLKCTYIARRWWNTSLVACTLHVHSFTLLEGLLLSVIVSYSATLSRRTRGRVGQLPSPSGNIIGYHRPSCESTRQDYDINPTFNFTTKTLLVIIGMCFLVLAKSNAHAREG